VCTHVEVEGNAICKKETDKQSILGMVGGAILAIMAVIMAKTQSITRLRVVCKALFDTFLFGSHETKIETLWQVEG
jgi:hypothetical protein